MLKPPTYSIWMAKRSARSNSPATIFGIEPNQNVLHGRQESSANCRQGAQSALTKGEVSYSTRKPWKQKGAGRARAGYTSSPVWTHGGVAFAEAA